MIGCYRYLKKNQGNRLRLQMKVPTAVCTDIAI